MVQFKILTGKLAGTVKVTRRFPVQIGRAADADLRLEEPGVWERHVAIRFKPREGYNLEVQGQALASINGHPVQEAMLRNGDLIELGAAKLQFWLADTRQRGLRLGEWFAWALIVVVSVAQVALVYLLLRS